MELIKQVIQTLNLPSTDHDEVEEWILTEEEENSAMAWAIMQKAKTYKHPKAEERVNKALEYYSGDVKREYLRQCNSTKHYEIWQEQQRLKRKTEEIEGIKMLKEKCNAQYFYDLFRYVANKKIIINSNNKAYLQTICFFFSNDARFETDLKLDFSKGLWIRGKAGVGKSFILNCIQENELIPFKVHSMIDVAQKVSENGEFIIPEILKVIDDVGSEQSIVNYYGTKVNWFKDFIEIYYAQNKPFNRLIVTTNFDFEQIEKSYGFRVRSRMKDMFNIIDVRGEDMRGK